MLNISCQGVKVVETHRCSMGIANLEFDCTKVHNEYVYFWERGGQHKPKVARPSTEVYDQWPLGGFGIVTKT